MATYSRQLTHHATATGGATDTITLTGPDKTQAGAADPAWKSPSPTGAAAINGGLIYNGGTVDLFFSIASSNAAAPPDPATSSNEGVRRLPAGATDEWDDVWPGAVLKVYAASDCVYSIEVNAA